jgi:hypothetical protein
LIKIINDINFESLSNKQLIILINDLKEITESVKETCENINYFSLNKSKKFTLNNTLQNKENIIKAVCTMSYLFNNNCFLGTLELNSETESDSLESELLDLESIEYDSSDSDSDSDFDSCSDSKNRYGFQTLLPKRAPAPPDQRWLRRQAAGPPVPACQEMGAAGRAAQNPWGRVRHR